MSFRFHTVTADLQIRRSLGRRPTPFSRGGQGLKIGLSHLDAFAYIGTFSAGGFEGSPNDFRKMNNGVMADADAFNRRVHLLWSGVGTAEPPDLLAGVRQFH